jgi:predicted SprT family Zn-dependent metalloprotease
MTVLEGRGEVVSLTVWAKYKKYASHSEDYKHIAFTVTGIDTPVAPPMPTSPQASEETVKPPPPAP